MHITPALLERSSFPDFCFSLYRSWIHGSFVIIVMLEGWIVRAIPDMRFQSWYTGIGLLVIAFYWARVFCSLGINWNRISRGSLHFLPLFRFSSNFHIFIASARSYKYSISALFHSLVVESKSWCSSSSWLETSSDTSDLRLVESRSQSWTGRTLPQQWIHSNISNI